MSSMELTSSNRAFTNRFERHVKDFIKDYRLVEGRSVLVGVSGGVDSMVLLFLLKRFGYSTRACFIHHGTRSGQDAELNLVKEFAEHLEIPFHFQSISGLNTKSNFEFNARLKRYEIFDELKGKSLVALAHHIDDSFEWTMLQSLQSSNLKSTVGIPVKNGDYIRPLMAVTKNQILRYAKAFDLPFINDPTNEDSKYERNFLRNEVISTIKQRHPKYLLHYVNKQNELARILGVHLLNKIQNSFEISFLKDAVSIYSLESNPEFAGIDELIRKAMSYLNPNDRGVLYGQIEKIKEALKNNKFGPLSLTKGVKVYISYHHLFMVNKKHSEPIYNQDFKFNDEFEKISLSEYKIRLKDYLQNFYPAWVIIENNTRGFNFNKRIFPYQSEVCRSLNEANISYLSALNLMAQWSKPKNKNKILKLRFISGL